MAKLVECAICREYFAVTNEQYNLFQKLANSLKAIGKAEFICNNCKKMVKTNE